MGREEHLATAFQMSVNWARKHLYAGHARRLEGRIRYVRPGVTPDIISTCILLVYSAYFHL